MGHVSWLQGPAADRADVAAPVVEVVLLEDRAQVTRRGTVKLAAGRNRLVLRGVSPIAQDLSLRAALADGVAARVADARLRRGLRIERAAKPEAVQALAAEVRGANARYTEQLRAAERARAVHGRVGEIVARGMDELPADVAWGLADRARWVETFEALFQRGREAADEAIERRFAAEDALRDAQAAAARARAADRLDHHVEAFVELDLVADGPLEASLSVVYTVPNALWRPVHRARLEGDTLRFESRAAVWQRTGEDWTNVRFAASTARTSLGTTAPLLSDDLLTARRREEKAVTLAAREVKVQRLGPEGGGGPQPASSAVDLPGVDDGGEVRHLVAERPVTIPGDGRPVFVDLFGFESPAARTRVLMAEVDPTVHLRVQARHAGRHPVLAGPVELVRDSGTVGWTETLYVAPGGALELGFGPDDALRAVRAVDVDEETDAVDKWTRRTVRVRLYLSNLGGEARTVQISERVPVSEVEQVKVAVLEGPAAPDGVAPHPADADGMWRVERTVPANGRAALVLLWQLSTAPGVRGL